MKKLLLVFVIMIVSCQSKNKIEKPDLVFVLVDQWRAQDLGFAGNNQVKTPALDLLAKESVAFIQNYFITKSRLLYPKKNNEKYK